MREEPVISGGILKAALAVVIEGALGVGAYPIAGGGIDLLPNACLDPGSTTDLHDTTSARATAA